MPDIPGFGGMSMNPMGPKSSSTPKKKLPLGQQVWNKLDKIFEGQTDATWTLWKKLNGHYNPKATNLSQDQLLLCHIDGGGPGCPKLQLVMLI